MVVQLALTKFGGVTSPFDTQFPSKVLLSRPVVYERGHCEASLCLAGRVRGFFADRCPIYRTLKSAIAITTELVLEAL